MMGRATVDRGRGTWPGRPRRAGGAEARPAGRPKIMTAIAGTRGLQEQLSRASITTVSSPVLQGEHIIESCWGGAIRPARIGERGGALTN